MLKKILMLLTLFGLMATQAQTVSLNGLVVQSSGGGPVSGVDINLIERPQFSTASDANGNFSLSSSAIQPIQISSDYSFNILGDGISLSLNKRLAKGQVEFYDLLGKKEKTLSFAEMGAGVHRFPVPALSPGLHFFVLHLDEFSHVRRLLSAGDKLVDLGPTEKPIEKKNTALLKAAPAVDTLFAVKAGYEDAKVPVHSLVQGNIRIIMKPICNLPAMPSRNQLPSISKLPDPFIFKIINGGDVTTKAEWSCRHEEIKAAAQEYIYGENPPADEVDATFSGGALNITVRANGSQISFSLNISGGDPNDPKPLLLSFSGFGSLPGWPSGIASATMPINQIAADAQTSSGLFYNLYGSNHSAGELAAWAWGVGRVIDALEVTPEAGIDPTKIAVHGCSRYGKGALAAGALEPRVALTIPEEAGSGGGSAWRIIAAEKASGRNIQTLSSTCSEQNWMHQNFCSWNGFENQLPIDQHEVMGLVAPRGLLFLDGDAGNDWLGVTATSWSAHATAEIFKALGAEEAFTYSQINSSHCTTPQGQSQYISAYARYYLLGQGSPPSGGVITAATRPFITSDWIDWNTPALQ